MGFGSLSPCLGLALVDTAGYSLSLDDAWTVREERDFTWWGKDIAQHVWSEPGFADDSGGSSTLSRWSDVAVTFDALTAPSADDLWSTGTQVYDNYYVESINGGASFSPPMRVSSTSSNPDSSSYNNLMEQFIGDYIDIVAGPARAYLVWTDARDASRCQAVDDYRNAVYAGSKTAVAPNPDIACATNFGNTDTEFAPVGY